MLKLWNVNNWEWILNIQRVNSNGCIISSCFLSHKNKKYIIASNCNYEDNPKPIKLYDFKRNKIKKINHDNDKLYLLMFIMMNYIQIFILFIVALIMLNHIIIIKMNYIINIMIMTMKVI